MAKKLKPLGKRILYKAIHPNYRSDNVFDSWSTLCEATLEIAQELAREELEPQFKELAAQIADEMINTAEEYESDE